MNRLIDATVFSGFVTAWRRANRPTRRSPLLETGAFALGVGDHDRLAAFDGRHH
jgi:hypothetical protein